MSHQPLADRMRPVSIDQIIGQDTALAPDGLIRRAISAGRLPSLILWGPPGCGKTTLAAALARDVTADFISMSAVTSGVADLRAVIERAKQNNRLGTATLLFVDEIHRWNKSQQDALLPHVETGTITLIGATTENPSFELRSALLSRCQVIVLQALQPSSIHEILTTAVSDPRGYAGSVTLEEDAAGLLANLSGGDARKALNALEAAALIATHITPDVAKSALQRMHLLYDKDGEQHFDLISALHKSLRGSDENAGLYYLARMLEGGEEPLYIARRLVRFASEDIGLANSRALEQAVAAYQACHFLGMPECNVILAQLVVYLARCKKSNALYVGYKAAAADVEAHGNLPVPLHLRNAPTKLMRDLDYGKDYKYSPDFDYQEDQDYLPEKLRGKKYL